jgi:YD repeat-containing protein
MRDLDPWDLHGPVRALRTHFAEWNPDTGDWWPLRSRAVASFRPDGQLNESEYHNPDGSVVRHVRVYDEIGRLTEEQWWANERLTNRALHTYDVDGRPASSRTVAADGTEREAELCRYDDVGRKTKVVFLSVPESSTASCPTSSCAMHYGVEGSDAAYAAPGATTSTTTYDERELPSEVSFHDANGTRIFRVMFSRDADGRVQSERMQFERPETFFRSPADVNVPTDERESLAEILTAAFEDRTLSLATYAYDEKGRRIETVRRMGQLSEERMTCRYDEHDNPVEQVTVSLSHDMRIDDGAVRIEEGPSHVQHVRFDYQYDVHGNWTERVVWQRTGSDTDDRRSNIERRTITYYESEFGPESAVTFG